MRPEKVKVAVIGCGTISEIYLTNMTQTFSILEVVGCSDRIPERSARRAEQFGIRQMTNEEILTDPEIQIVAVLTDPDNHYEVTRSVLNAGKHAYCEKMMAVRFEEGLELDRLAREKGLMYCVAPDTFLGGGAQTARKYIDSGMIGQPMYANATVVRNYEHAWEGPDPYTPFILTPGGGIPYDMGGYYLHAMINALGPIARVSGFSRRLQEEGSYLNPRHEHYGERTGSVTPTLFTASLEFACGAYGTLTAISEGFGETSRLEFFGTEGTLIAHDPNLYGESMYLIRRGADQETTPYEIPFTHGYYHGNYRGIAVADMAWALRNGRAPRCSRELGLHAFEVIHGVRESCRTGTVYTMTTRCERPAPLPSGFAYNFTQQEACMDDRLQR